MSYKYIDVVDSSDGANPVFLIKRDDIGNGRHIAYNENQAKRLHSELEKVLKNSGVIEE